MTSRRHIAAAAAAVVLFAGVSLSAIAQAPVDDAKYWLDRMNTAIEELNYRGRFVHVFDGNAEMLQIVHRFADGKVRERITTEGDEGREILRTNDAVLTVIPDERRVLSEELRNSSLPRTGALIYTDALRSLYDVQTSPRGEVAGRDTQYISIRPRDAYRYGYRLWLDRETALPLKSQVLDEDGQVLEQVLYTEIELVDAVDENELNLSIGVDGFEWIRRITPAEPASPSDEIWGATRLPDGFTQTMNRQSLLAGSTYPVRHLVYTDGLATVSVYIAHPKSDARRETGFSRIGSANMYSLTIDGRLVIAVGEVPPRTVERIATSLDAR